MSISLKVKGIKTLKHESVLFVKVFLFLPGENIESHQTYALFSYKFYLVENLKTNILVRNNIFILEGFIFNLKIGHAIVENCKVTIFIKTRQKS